MNYHISYQYPHHQHLPSPSRPLLVHHVAVRLGLSRRMIRYLAETGQLRAHKLGKKIWVFCPDDVAEFGRTRCHMRAGLVG